MRNEHEIRIRSHEYVGAGAEVHEKFVVSCNCGHYEKVENDDFPTHAGRKRAAMFAAMNHNTQRHAYGYKIKETS